MTAGAPLVVLGASEEQLPLYREARRRGIPTVAVDQRADCPSIPLADRFLQISTRDWAGVAEALGPGPIASVVSTAADTCLLSWHELSERYGTPFRFPLAAALASMDKGRFHELAAAAGLPTYPWVQAADLDRLRSVGAGMRFPLVAKPYDGSGSRGTTLVASPAELPAALACAAAASHGGKVILEEFLQGRNLTVNLFLRSGAAHFAAVTEKRVVPGPHFLIGGHTCPAPLEPAVHRLLVDQAVTACLAMGLTDGPANLDVVLSPDGIPYVLEVGARMSGNGMPRLMRAAYGVDCTAALMDLALGRPFDLSPTRSASAILQVLVSPCHEVGHVTAVDGLAEVAAMPHVADVELFVRPGDLVRPFRQAADKIGHLVVRGADPVGAEAALADALPRLSVRLRPAATLAPAASAALHERPGAR